VLAIKCVDGIVANEKRCRYYANATISIAAALNPYIDTPPSGDREGDGIKTGERDWML